MQKKMFKNLLDLSLQLKEKKEAYVDITWTKETLHLYMYSLKGFCYETILKNTEEGFLGDSIASPDGINGLCVSYEDFCKAIDKTKVKDGMRWEVEKSAQPTLNIYSGKTVAKINSLPQHTLRMNLDRKNSLWEIDCKDTPVLHFLDSLKTMRFTIGDELTPITSHIHVKQHHNSLYFMTSCGSGLNRIGLQGTGVWEEDCLSFPTAYAKNFNLFNQSKKIQITVLQKGSKKCLLFKDENDTRLQVPVNDALQMDILFDIYALTDTWKTHECSKEWKNEWKNKLKEEALFKKNTRNKYTTSDKFGVGVYCSSNNILFFDTEDEEDRKKCLEKMSESYLTISGVDFEWFFENVLALDKLNSLDRLEYQIECQGEVEYVTLKATIGVIGLYLTVPKI